MTLFSVFQTIKKRKKTEETKNKDNTTRAKQLPPYNPNQLVCPHWDNEMVNMHITRRRLLRLLATETKHTMVRLL